MSVIKQFIRPIALTITRRYPYSYMINGVTRHRGTESKRDPVRDK